jgi:acylphosphatase
MNDVIKRIHVYYSGHVQGVGFRFTAEAVARRFKLSGYAKNLRDGRVELVAEGPEGNLKEMLVEVSEAMKRQITDESVHWGKPTGEYRGFGILDDY